MGVLFGLEGVRGNVRCMEVNSIAAALRALTRYRAATSAGDNGAISAWRDDEGRLRSEYCRFCVVLESAEHSSLHALRLWLKEWWPKMHGEQFVSSGRAPN